MKKTKWFKAGVKPARYGMYEVRIKGIRGVFWAQWSGREWGCAKRFYAEALYYPAYDHAMQKKMWRGLTKEAK